MEQRNNGILITTFLVVTIVTLPLWFSAAFNSGVHPEEPEVEEPVKMYVSLSLPSVEPPDVSYALVVAENRGCARKTMEKVSEIYERIDTIEVAYEKVQLVSLGTYYITGYTSIECGGSTTTASGTTCHKAASYEDSFKNPTTCAIDPKIHDFGDIFFIEEFGYYIAEDTGSAVKNKHLDLYFWDSEYNYALSITGYYEVFSVEYVSGSAPAGAYDVRPFVLENMLEVLVGADCQGYT